VYKPGLVDDGIFIGEVFRPAVDKRFHEGRLPFKTPGGYYQNLSSPSDNSGVHENAGISVLGDRYSNQTVEIPQELLRRVPTGDPLSVKKQNQATSFVTDETVAVLVVRAANIKDRSRTAEGCFELQFGCIKQVVPVAADSNDYTKSGKLEFTPCVHDCTISLRGLVLNNFPAKLTSLTT
jgi:hypothetical protein